ncbi:SAM-dependent methyltransferase [Peptostreptococcaceae bacterium AGR-M142]
MKKQNVEKLNLFLSGLENRVRENEKFFKLINLYFKSGRKTFKSVINLKNNLFEFKLDGKVEQFSFSDLIIAIKRECLKYDSIKIEYIERGTTILIEGDDKNVNIKYVDNNDIVSTMDENSIVENDRKYYVKVGQANELLKEIGILTKEGKLKNDMIRKYNQIDHFVELLDKVLNDIKNINKNEITIVDCACGKSYLSFVLNYYIKEILKKNCHFICIDNSKTVIEKSKQMAKNLSYNNMDFINEDIVTYNMDEEIDILMSLHACDTATDMAIALGIRNNAKAIISVPCCHKEFLSQYKYDNLKSIFKHNIFKKRFADLMTDGLRTLFLEGYGYDVSALEYISPLDTPKNLMIRAIKTKEKNKDILNEYKRLQNEFQTSLTLDKLVY